MYPSPASPPAWKLIETKHRVELPSGVHFAAVSKRQNMPKIVLRKLRHPIKLGVAVMLSCLMLAPIATLGTSANRGPDVIIVAEKNRMIYEFRQNGHLRMIRVVPNVGRPYYLVPRDPTNSDGDLRRVESLVPSWVLWEFD